MQDPENNMIAVDLMKLYAETKPKELLVCSYTLGLGYLEQKIFSKLKKKYDTKITVVTSLTGLNESFNEATALNGVGTEYFLYQINDFPYAFHPKIFATIDINGEFAICAGGANFTYPGICLNMDACDQIKHDEIGEQSKRNISAFFDELESQIQNNDFTTNISRFRYLINQISINEDPDVLFINNFKETIAQQITNYVAENVIKLRIISPYYDSNMGALVEFVKILGRPKTEILFNKDDKNINLKKIPDNFQIYCPNHSKIEAHRFLHAKIYIIYTEKTIYTITGSANCTWPGLMSTCKNGNWESCIARKNIQLEYIESLWNSYLPEALFKEKYWEFINPNKDQINKNQRLFFSADMNFDAVVINPIKNFPEEQFDAKVNLLLRNGDEIQIDLVAQKLQNEIYFQISSNIKDIINNDPFRIEIFIEKPSLLWGQSWVMQKQQLYKTIKIRRLDEAIRKLQNDNPEGWDKILEIIDFISSNIVIISAKPQSPTSKKRGEKGHEKSGLNKIYTISGVYNVDDIVQMKDLEINIGEIKNIAASIEKLIEKGISGFIDDYSDNDDMDENSFAADSGTKNKKKRKKTYIESENKEEAEERKRDIISQMPDLSIMFMESIKNPFDRYFREDSQSLNDFHLRFEALLNSINFCLKFIRFIRLELSNPSTGSFLSINIKKYFNEIIPIIRWFWKKYPNIKEKFAFTDDYLKEVFTSTANLPEMLNCLFECWHFNIEGRFFGGDLFFYAINEFNRLFNPIEIQNLQRLFLQNTRFERHSNNLLYDLSKRDDFLNNIDRYTDKLSSIGSKYKKHIKFLYWEQAYLYHTEALERYKRITFDSDQNFDEHKKRQKIALYLMNKVKKEGPVDLQAFYDEKIYINSKVVGISELINEFQYVLCPACKWNFEIGVYEILKRFETLQCPGCSRLIIPVDKYPQYIFKDAKDSEWQLVQDELAL